MGCSKTTLQATKVSVSVLVRDQGVQASLIEDVDSVPERWVGEKGEEAKVEEHMQCEVVVGR